MNNYFSFLLHIEKMYLSLNLQENFVQFFKISIEHLKSEIEKIN